MAYALVGAVGAAAVSASNATVTPSWGAGASRTAGNLLLCFASETGTVVNGTIQVTGAAGWMDASQTNTTGVAVGIFYKVATGGDAAPTLGPQGGSSGVITVAHLEEWSGGDSSSPLDRSGTAAGSSSPVTATLAAANAAANQLVAIAGADRRSVARASNDTWTSNHGTPTLRASNNGVSSTDHYSQATLISNSSASADTAIMTLSITTSITGLAVAAASFKLAAAAGADDFAPFVGGGYYP